MPSSRLDDPGIGLRGNGRRVLTYADLQSLFSDPDGREPGRTIELHLTGHMERFVWSFDGVKFSDAEPIRLTYGERMRIVLVNDTMMAHPMHLHGMWSDIEDDDGTVVTWLIEGGSPNELIRNGVTKNTLAIGTALTVEGYQAKDGTSKAVGRNFTLGNGERMFLGGSASRVGADR